LQTSDGDAGVVVDYDDVNDSVSLYTFMNALEMVPRAQITDRLDDDPNCRDRDGIRLALGDKVVFTMEDGRRLGLVRRKYQNRVLLEYRKKDDTAMAWGILSSEVQLVFPGPHAL
jgi:hypothetical protein